MEVWTRERESRLTISKGATIQLAMMLKPICIHNCFSRKALWSVSYRTLQRIGYIMTSNPTAMGSRIISNGQAGLRNSQCRSLPIGTETPTNFPRCNADPVLGTKLPSRIPMMMASRIHRARSRSSQPRALKAETFSSLSRSSSCFSTSVRWSDSASASPVGEDLSERSSCREEAIVEAGMELRESTR
jgi:hypothetical protein